MRIFHIACSITKHIFTIQPGRLVRPRQDDTLVPGRPIRRRLDAAGQASVTPRGRPSGAPGLELVLSPLFSCYASVRTWGVLVLPFVCLLLLVLACYW